MFAHRNCFYFGRIWHFWNFEIVMFGWLVFGYPPLDFLSVNDFPPTKPWKNPMEPQPRYPQVKLLKGWWISWQSHESINRNTDTAYSIYIYKYDNVCIYIYIFTRIICKIYTQHISIFIYHNSSVTLQYPLVPNHHLPNHWSPHRWAHTIPGPWTTEMWVLVH